MLLFNPLPQDMQPSHFYFNTSNVTIQRLIYKAVYCKIYYFNTSNVTIQQCRWRFSLVHKIISIHLMLLFNL